MTTINSLSVELRWWVESRTIVISCGLSTMLRHHTQMLFSEICGSTHPILDFEAKLLAWDNVDKANALDDYYWSISNLDFIRHCFFVVIHGQIYLKFHTFQHITIPRKISEYWKRSIWYLGEGDKELPSNYSGLYCVHYVQANSLIAYYLLLCFL